MTYYSPTEVNQLVETVEELIDHVESLSTQLQKAELKNKKLLDLHQRMYERYSATPITVH